MSISLTVAATSAAQFLDVLDSGEALSSQQITDAFGVANRLLMSWYEEQVQAFAELVAEQNRQGQILVQEQAKIGSPLAAAYTLAGGTYTVAVFTAPSFTPASAPQFADNTTPITLPGGYERAFILSFAIELAPQYDMQPSAALMKQAAEARAAANPMPGKIPIPGLSVASEASPQ